MEWVAIIGSVRSKLASSRSIRPRSVEMASMSFMTLMTRETGRAGKGDSPPSRGG